MTQTGLDIQEEIPLAPLTTIGLGGPARYFAACRSVEEIRAGLLLARDRGVPLHVLGGGSNLIFADHGFPGLVLKIDLPGIAFRREGQHVLVTAAAGETWDDLVGECVRRGLGGLECLSGIPGSVGATPIQNVGAYGQEVSQILVGLRAVDRNTLEEVSVRAAECDFGYRSSRFKGPDRGRYVITEVTFRLRPEGRPEIRYPELARHIAGRADLETLAGGRAALEAVRRAVLDLRRNKSMLADPEDPNARSVGSFFLNPVLSERAFGTLLERWQSEGEESPVPAFPEGGAVKVPAAWLVERAGFPKGYRRGGAGISTRHALALINRGGTTAELLELAEEIRRGVRRCFGVDLEIEPDIVAGPAGGQR